jgi:hypothetical protein
MKKPNISLNKNNDSFREFTRKLVAVPKKEIDKQLELEQKDKEKEKTGKRK